MKDPPRIMFALMLTIAIVVASEHKVENSRKGHDMILVGPLNFELVEGRSLIAGAAARKNNQRNAPVRPLYNETHRLIQESEKLPTARRWITTLDHVAGVPGAGIPNHNPLFDRGSDITVVEDSGIFGPELWARNIVDGDGPLVAGRETNSGRQSVAFTVVAANPILFDGVAGQPTIADDGILTFTPAPDQCGTSTVSVELRDDGNPACVDGVTTNNGMFVCPGACSPTDCHVSVEVEFVVTVICVNDPPRFRDLGDQVSIEDSGTVTVVNWAFQINKGAGDSRAAITNFELEQSLMWTVTNNNPQLFAIQPTILWDAMNPATADLTYAPAAGQCGMAQVTVQLQDSGGTNNGGSDTMVPPRTFLITITCDNDPPSFTCGDTVQINEDHGFYTQTNWATLISKGNGFMDSAENTQNLFFDLQFVNPAHANLFAVQPTISPTTGTLTFQALPDANTFGRVVELYVRLRDDGGMAPRDRSCDPITSCCRLTIIINAINDPPSYVCGPDIVVCEDLDNLPVSPTPPIYTDGNGWATQISLGAVNEGVGLGFEGQRMIFTLINSNPALFANGPSIDAAGTLTFELVPNANGVATVTVNSRDTGPAGPPGSNAGPTCTFTITVLPVSDPPSFQLPLAMPLIVTEDDPPSLTDWPNFAVQVSRGPSDEASQTLSFSVTNDNPRLFTVQPDIELISTTTGRLRFELAPDMCGVANLDIILSDNGDIQACNGRGSNTARRPFQIKVDCVNDVPTFRLGPECCAKRTTCTGAVCAIILCEDEAVNGYLQSAFATNIRPGPDKFDENSMNVAFTVTTDSDSLFSTPPSISPTGTLTFTTARDAFGEALMRVTLTDDGVPPMTSEVENYVITIRPSNDPPTFSIRSDLLGNTVRECTAPYDPRGCTLPSTAPGCSRSFPNWIFDVLPGNPGSAPGPSNEISQSVVFSVAVDANAADLFTVPPFIDPVSGTLSFTTRVGANTQTPITLVITARDDGGSVQGGVMNGVSTCPGQDTAIRTLQLEILPVNNAPCFTCGGDVSVLEDAGPTTILSHVTDITAGPPDELSQVLQFSLVSDTPTMFSDPPQIDSSTGTLTFTSGPDQCGSTEITVSLDDSQALNNVRTCRFTLSVLPVNDQPTFRGQGEVTANEDNGATCTQWIKESNAGAFEDFTSGSCDRQSLRYEVTNTNTDLFTVQPVVSSTGELCFHPAQDQCGTSTVTITLIDSGGVDHSGIDRSITQTFPIVIECINDAPSFNMGPSIVVCEDSGAQIVPQWCSSQTPGPLINENCPPHQQLLTFTLTTNTPDLFLVQPQIDRKTCSLSFTPSPNANGIATVTVLLCDNGNSIPPHQNCAPTDQFTITVRAVNDPPSYRKGSDIILIEDAPPYFNPAWAKNIVKGPTAAPGSENLQTLEFILRADRPELFSIQPAIHPVTGDLTLVLANNANGITRVSACLKDSGGTIVRSRAVTTLQGILIPGPQSSVSATNGLATCLDGADTFCDEFTITVEPCNDPPQFLNAANVEVTEDSGQVTFARWMEQLTTGPLDERHQVLEVVQLETPPDKRQLFTQLPTLSQTTGDLTFTPAPHASGTAIITIVLQDNGGILNGCQDVTREQFTITINPVNDKPTFKRGQDVIVLEDSPRYVNTWATDILPGPLEVEQTVRFAVSAAVPELFVEQPAISSEGILTFVPAQNAFGEALVTVRAIDSGGGLNLMDSSEIEVFSITIQPVNDPPTFNKGADLTVLEDSPPVCITRWASNIMSGPANERNQLISFTATPRCCQLFGTGPNIDPITGDLCFTVAPSAFGDVVIDIVASDSGGTANGGISESAPVPFSISITPVNDPPFFLRGPDVSVLEDAPDQTFPNWAKSASPGPFEDSQALTYTTSSLIGMFSVIPKVWVASGDLTFAPAADRNGDVRVDVTLSDNGGSDNMGLGTYSTFFFINIIPVNDRPSFTIGSDVLADEDSAPVLIPNWASQLSPGPPDEVGQKLQFFVTTDKPEMFLVQPTIRVPGGDVQFSLAPNANGVVLMTAVLADDGGVANGGIDSTDPAAFRLTVNPVNDPPVFSPGIPTVSTVSGTSGGTVSRQWATQISAGPADEPQGVTFVLSVSNPELFTTPGPSISPNGVLTFIAAPNAVGNSTIVVTARDSQGAVSIPQVLQIVINNQASNTIRAVLDMPQASFDANTFKSIVGNELGIPPDRVLITDIKPDTIVDFQFSNTGAPGEVTSAVLTDRFLAAATSSTSLRQSLQLLEAYPRGNVNGQGNNPMPTAGSTSDSGLDTVWIVVLVIAGVILLAVIAGIIFFLWRRKKRRKAAQEAAVNNKDVAPAEVPRNQQNEYLYKPSGHHNSAAYDPVLQEKQFAPLPSDATTKSGEELIAHNPIEATFSRRDVHTEADQNPLSANYSFSDVGNPQVEIQSLGDYPQSMISRGLTANMREQFIRDRISEQPDVHIVPEESGWNQPQSMSERVRHAALG